MKEYVLARAAPIELYIEDDENGMYNLVMGHTNINSGFDVHIRMSVDDIEELAYKLDTFLDNVQPQEKTGFLEKVMNWFLL